MLPQTTLGIDIAKETMHCTLLSAAASQPLWQGVLPRTAAGLASLLQLAPPEAAWVVEPTGPYSTLVVESGRAAGRTVLLAPPKAAKSFLNSLQQRAKTDRLDSFGLGRYGLAVPLRDYPLRDAVTEQLQQLVRARRGLSDAKASLGQQAQALPGARAVLQPALDALQRQLVAVERELERLLRKEPSLSAARELRKVPGIGLVTTATALACLEAKQFERADQFVAHIGLDVKVMQSGRRQGQAGLSKHGDAELRRLFYLCARSSVTAKDGPFTADYDRLVARQLPKTGALNAVARKLARLCWSLHHYQASYDPHRVHHQPTRAQPAPL